MFWLRGCWLEMGLGLVIEDCGFGERELLDSPARKDRNGDTKRSNQ